MLGISSNELAMRSRATAKPRSEANRMSTLPILTRKLRGKNLNELINALRR